MHLKKIAAFGAAAALLFTAHVPACAAGFAVYEWDSWGVALADAMMFSDSPSVIGFNPAGITQFDANGSVAFGATCITPVGTAHFYRNGKQVATSDNTISPCVAPYAFFAKQISDSAWFGLGLYPRFGLASKFPSDFPGRFNNYLADFKTLSVAPTIALKISPSLSLSFGGDLMWTDLELGRAIGWTSKNPKPAWAPFSSYESHMNLHGKSFGTGWNVGLNWQASDKLSMAAVYRSKIKQTISHATTTFTQPQTNFGPVGVGGETFGRGTVTLPDSWTFGLGWKFDEKTRVEFDAIYTRWSSYNSLDITFDTFFPLLPALGPGALNYTVVSPKNWKDQWRFQLGVEHRMNSHWTLGAGVAWDDCPSPDQFSDFIVPVGSRTTYSLGAQYVNKGLKLSFSAGYMDIEDKPISSAGGPLGDPDFTCISRSCYATIFGLACQIDM